MREPTSAVSPWWGNLELVTTVSAERVLIGEPLIEIGSACQSCVDEDPKVGCRWRGLDHLWDSFGWLMFDCSCIRAPIEITSVLYGFILRWFLVIRRSVFATQLTKRCAVWNYVSFFGWSSDIDLCFIGVAMSFANRWRPSCRTLRRRRAEKIKLPVERQTLDSDQQALD